MSKTIQTFLLISILLFAFLQSASSQKLRSLQEEQSFNLVGEAETIASASNDSDGFELDDGDSTESTPTTTDHAANYDLGEVDATSAPAPTTTDATVGASNQNEDSTSFVLGDDDETPTVSNTQNNAVTTTESNEGEQSFELKEDEPVGASASTEGEQSFELKDDVDATTSLGASSGSHEDTSFELVDNDDTKNVDLTDPADESSSTDKNSGANNNGRALSVSSSTKVVTKFGASLQTGLVMVLVGVVSALVL